MLQALSKNGEYIGERYVRLLHVPKSEMEEQASDWVQMKYNWFSGLLLDAPFSRAHVCRFAWARSQFQAS